MTIFDSISKNIEKKIRQQFVLDIRFEKKLTFLYFWICLLTHDNMRDSKTDTFITRNPLWIEYYNETIYKGEVDVLVDERMSLNLQNHYFIYLSIKLIHITTWWFLFFLVKFDLSINVWVENDENKILNI